MSLTAPAAPSTAVPDPSDDFLPLYPDQDEPTILSRLADWANEGLDAVADAGVWVDTREGSHFFTNIVPIVREFARLYDLLGTEVPMAAFVLWAWETYLDDLGAVYQVFRLPGTPSLGTETFSGAAGTVISAGVTMSAVPSTPDNPAPLYEVTTGGTIPDLGGGVGTLDLPIQATEVGEAGDVGADAITAQSTPLPGITFTNGEPTLGGTDIETDDALRVRILDAIAAQGPGNVIDYIRWAGAWPGVGRVSVVPVWDGAGTVLVMVSDPNGQPLPDAIVDALQIDLDPIPGEGHGQAPVGAQVTVDTSTLLNVAITGTVTFEDGYTWDGAGGSIAVGPFIQAAVTSYMLTVQPGGEVILAHVTGLFATYPGVLDATGFELNGVAANLAVSLTPPKVPVVASITLS